ncbi:dihydrofolate reductase family protein [Actinomadura flavalba]|uniref:dihydrofolate reductase family protein n=1 Tax=Actinomadura flavalba TaxID=1120938 RepID=UPI000369B565|nr:dihydrofolate reductase family protein [Actinomadura flavalba]
MRKIINSTYISLDGVIENPHLWTMKYFGEGAAAYARELLFSCDALLNGRLTYEAFAQTWPSMEEQTGDFGVRMNTLPHYVVSTSLKEDQATWANTTIIRDDVPAALVRLKEEPGQDILQYGFGDVSRLLVEHDLLDELRLWIHPVIVGTGTPSDLLAREGFASAWNLADTTTLDTGVIVATFTPDRSEES